MKTIKKTLKTILYVTILAVVIAAAYIGYTYYNQEEVSYEAPKLQVIQPKLSDVEEAKKLLIEATAKLDAEEARVLAEIEVLEAELENINKVRLGFTKTNGQ